MGTDFLPEIHSLDSSVQQKRSKRGRISRTALALKPHGPKMWTRGAGLVAAPGLRAGEAKLRTLIASRRRTFLPVYAELEFIGRERKRFKYRDACKAGLYSRSAIARHESRKSRPRFNSAHACARASASASEPRAEASQPVSPALTMSGMPPIGNPTTGVPQAMASKTTFGRLSTGAG